MRRGAKESNLQVAAWSPLDVEIALALHNLRMALKQGKTSMRRACNCAWARAPAPGM